MHICGLPPQVNGTVNVLIMPSKNPYTFGLTLLDMFFFKGGTLYVTTVLQQQE